VIVFDPGGVGAQVSVDSKTPYTGGVVTVAGIISAIIVGLIIGALGRLVVPGRQSIPLWLTMLVGIGAALLGTAIARSAGVATTPGVDWIELLIQVGLAALGVILVVSLGGRRRSYR
jgi:uncharacterized membrane protein YeaQ/YmgE (transglycosylase-associated protein family)